jgi:Spy/CpxP family protein refolding chaperone
LNRFLKNAAVTIALAVVAGAGGVLIGGKLLQPQPRPSLHEAVHRELSLTDAQNQEIHALETSFASRRQELEADMRAANAELARAIKSSEAMSPEVEAAVRHFHSAMGTLQTETIEHVFAMRRVLAPEQRARFDELVSEALTSDQQ